MFIVADLWPTGHESGSGVLARMTLQALGPGSSAMALGEVILADPESRAMGDIDGDNYFDGPVSSAQVWVDEPCPSPLPTLTPSAPPAISPSATPDGAPVSSPVPTTVGPASPTPVPPAVGAPGDALSTETEDEDGFPWAIIVGVSAGAVVVAAGAALVLRRLLRQSG